MSYSADVKLRWDLWSMPGVLGVVVNAWACVYLVIIFFFSFWPQTTPTTAATKNSIVLVTGPIMLFGVVYYFVWGRKTYVGPVVEVMGGNLE